MPVTLLSALETRFSTPACALGLGLASSSYFFFGNLALARTGIMEGTKDAPSKEFGLSVGQRLALWNWFYDRGSKTFPVAAIGTTTAFVTAAVTYDPPAGAPPLRALLLTAAAVSFIVMPFTVLFIFPVNNDLKRRLKKARSGTSVQLSATEEKDTLKILETWRTWNAIRLSIGGVGWALGIVAAIMSA